MKTPHKMEILYTPINQWFEKPPGIWPNVAAAQELQVYEQMYPFAVAFRNHLVSVGAHPSIMKDIASLLGTMMRSGDAALLITLN